MTGSTTDVFVLDTVRTPIGRHGGGLAGVRPDDLAAHVLRSLVDRNPGLDPAMIDDVFMGNGNGAHDSADRDSDRLATVTPLETHFALIISEGAA